MRSEPDDFNWAAAQAAAEWVARRDRGLTPAEALALAEWQRANPQHRTELERIAGTWRELDGAGAVPELQALADAFVVRARARRQRRRFVRFASVTFGAAAALAVGLISWDRFHPAPESAALHGITENYRVLASTLQRTILPDGSVAELNGESRIEVDFRPDERRVRLAEGEAHFIVATNPERPFVVVAGPVTVRAVGTAFNVRLDSGSIEVLVTEGTVKLEKSKSVATQPGDDPMTESPPALVQGQRAVINLATDAAPANVAIGDVGKAEINEALGWQSTRLVFNNTPLDEVVEGFNRYNSHRLTIGDAKLRSRTLTGVFRADNLDGFVRLLKASVDVKAELRTPTETVLLPAR
jgi:transmembrane sensor